MDTQFDSRQSLALITEMINNTRTQMERNAGRPLLIWGYVTVAVTLAVWFALLKTGNTQWNLLWIAIPVLGGLIMFLTPNHKNAGVSTYVDRIIGYIWLVIGLAGFCVGILAMFLYHQMQILFIITLLMGIGATLTGLVSRFTPGIAGGVAGILLSVGCLVVPGLNGCLIFAVAFFIMMVVPGHILNYHSNRRKNRSQHV